MKAIQGIAIRWEHDESADVSWLETTAESHYGENGSAWSHVDDEGLGRVVAKHGSILEACEHYAQQDAARLAAFHAGDWHLEGCYAVASVTVDGTRQTIRTPGLWGIESDSGEEYRREVEEEERAALLGILSALGFDTTEETTRLLDSLLAQVTQEEAA